MNDDRNNYTDKTYLKDHLGSVKTILFKFCSQIIFKNSMVFINALMICLALFSIVFANPQGGQVAAGNATIQQTPNTTVINQSTDKAIINWNTFNIAPNEATHFQQPSSSSVTLNRINPGQGASQIFGLLTANGQIILINQAGIFFASGSHIDVGGIIASTADITNANFLAGKYTFDQPSLYSGSIINEGTIIASQNGLVALLGSGVSNKGLIQANLGTVVLASGSQFTITFTGNQLISFTIDSKALNTGVDQNGKTLNNAVINAGKIIANGGKIILTAQNAGSTLDNAINMSGIAQARSISKHNGEIILSANEGNIHVSGKLDVSGKQGGKIIILGSQITLTSSSKLYANGIDSGGEILIGGNLHGAGPLPNALNTTIDLGAQIQANALKYGNGGKIIIWSDNTTNFAGYISATGGVLGGNGGFAEVSGHQLLIFKGTVDLSAAQGVTGTLLLDPENLTIQTAGSTTATNSGNTYTSNVDNSILTVADLQAALANANVLIQTGVGGLQAGDITVANNITWGNANTLTLSAFHNINIDASITNSLGGSLSLRSDNTGTGIGTIAFAGATPQVNMSGGGTVNLYYNPVSFSTPTDYSSNVSVSAGTIFTPYMLVNTASQLQNINSNLSGDYALGSNITLSGNFTPLGSVPTPFTGQFNGLTNSINNLSITNSTPNTNLGLFGVETGATIANVNLNNVSITQTADNSGTSIYIGGLVGLMNGGTITNSSVVNPLITASGTNFGMNGSRGYYDIGGLVGAIFGGSVSSSFTSGGKITDSVNVNSAANMIAFHEVGGLIGGEHSGAVLQNDYSSTAINADGNVTISGANGTGELLVGGLVGRLDQLSFALNTHSSGVITVTSTMSIPSGSGAAYVLVGGLVGISSIANAGTPTPPPVIDNSYSTSPVTLNATLTNSPPSAAEFLVGGLLGQSNGVLTNSYSSGPVVANLTSDVTAAGNYFYAGGLAADNFTIIRNSYSSSPVTVTGTNNGSQVEVGGLVGSHVTLFDKEITGSYSSGTINVTMNNLNNGQLFVGGLIGSIIYYGNAATLWPFTDNYSTSAINVSGQNNASWTAVGGLIGTNGQDVGDPGGNIKNSYSQGFINTQITTSNGGTTEVGGFMGADIGSSATLTNNFWDTDTSGFNQNQGVGNTPGVVAGLTPGCFGGTCTNGGTANLSAQATFTNAGWDFINTWGISEGQSYPYLIGLNPVTPQAFSGTVPGVINNGVTLVENGSTIGLTSTGANGFFYFLQPGGISATTPLLAYLSGSSLVGNILFKVPSPASNVSGLNFSTNAITVGGVNTSIFSNTDLATAIGNLSNVNILYSASGISNITLGNSTNPNVNFNTTPTTTYTLDGNLPEIAGGSSSIVFGGPVVLAANVTLNAASINFENTVSGSANNLVINSIGTTTFGNTASLANLTVSANTIDINTNSITTTGSQIYNSPVVLGNDATMIGTQINFENGIKGGNNLTLSGEPGDDSFSLLGPLSLNNITVTGSTTGNNLLSAITGVFENWLITGLNKGSGVIPGVNGMIAFSNIQNLTGGNSGNTFSFNDGASISGLINGGSVSSINTLDYSSYLTPVTTTFTSLYSGSTQNSAAAYITHFININKLSGSTVSVLPLPDNLTTLPVITKSFIVDVIDQVNNFNNPGIISEVNNLSIINNAIYNTMNAASIADMLNIAATQYKANVLESSSVNFWMSNILMNNILVTANEINKLMLPNFMTSYISRIELPKITNYEAYSSRSLPLYSEDMLLSFVIFSLIFISLMQTQYKRNYNLAIAQRNNLKTVSFDMRSALVSVRGFAGLMYANEVGQLSGKQKEFIGDILTESDNILSNLINVEMDNTLSKKVLTTLKFNLNTSLNSIIGFASLIYNGEVGIISPLQKEFLGDIIMGSDEALQTVADKSMVG